MGRWECLKLIMLVFLMMFLAKKTRNRIVDDVISNVESQLRGVKDDR